MEALLPSSISPKISAILQSHVYPRLGRVLRALARVKSVLLDALGAGGTNKWGPRRRRLRKHRIGGRGFAKRPPHLTWSGGGGGLSPAARTAADEEAQLDVSYHVYYPCYGESAASSSAVVVPAAAAVAAGEYDCGYLRWLEEEEIPDEVVLVEEDDSHDDDAGHGVGGNEIDRLAEEFIARCRANFLLEKQESYDRCQEMIARSL